MIRKICLVHHTHMDIGYTDLPAEVMRFQRSYLDRALCLCEEDPDFRWTIESARLLKDYIAHRPEADVERIMALLRRGQMELMGFDCQPLMELCSPLEQKEICAWAAEQAARHQIPLECAMLDDIGGWPATLADFCSGYGVKYLIAGVGAYQVFLPWEKSLPHLFRHRSPGGKTVTVWNLGIDRNTDPRENGAMLMAVYGLGMNYIINPWKRRFGIGQAVRVEAEGSAADPDYAPEERFAELEARLNAENYPYEEVMLQCGGDNRGPDPVLPELVRRINATGKMPEIELTTPSVFMRRMEERYGDRIPEFSGLLADPWVTRCNPAPASLKAYRNAQRQYALASKLHSLHGSGECEEKLAGAADALALYSDHTCGLSVWHSPNVRKEGENIGTGEYLKMRESWREKRFYADRAAKDAAEAAALSAGKLFGHAGKSPLAGVYNPASYIQDGYVTLYTGRNGGVLKELHDSAGNPVEFENAGHHRYFCRIPAMGAQEIRLLHGELERDRDLWCVPPAEYSPVPEQWSNPYFTVQFGSNCRIESLRLRADHHCAYSRTDTAFPFLEPLLELPQDYPLEWAKAGMEPLTRLEYPAPEYHSAGLRHSGKLTDVIERRGCFPGRFEFVLRWKLYHNAPRIDVELEIAKEETASLESIYLACPLSGKAQKWLLHTADSSADLSRDLLPGSMKDCFYAARGISCLSGGKWWTVYSPDVPVTHIGEPRNFRWSRERDFEQQDAGFFPQICHNLLITDSPSFQKINEMFRFSLIPDHDRPAEEAQIFFV